MDITFNRCILIKNKIYIFGIFQWQNDRLRQVISSGRKIKRFPIRLTDQIIKLRTNQCSIILNIIIND